MKTSNIFEDFNVSDSNAYLSLAPKMKQAVNEFYKMLDTRHDDGSYQDDNFCENIEDCVKKTILKHDIKKEQLLDYIELEVREQLKIEV
tara:strand:- start:438 stop:704 length:267 start_codon:yes stop_codon:yes gene_type:complete